MKIFNNGSCLKAVCINGLGLVKAGSSLCILTDDCDVVGDLRLWKEHTVISSVAEGLWRNAFPLVWSLCVVCKSGDPAFEKELRSFKKQRHICGEGVWTADEEHRGRIMKGNEKLE